MKARPDAAAPRSDPFRSLATAVCLQAVEDWRSAVRRLEKEPEARNAWELRELRQETEEFFRSDWFRALSGFSGEWLLAELAQGSAGETHCGGRTDAEKGAKRH